MRWWKIALIVIACFALMSIVMVSSKERLMFFPSSRLDSIYGGSWVTFGGPLKLSGFHIKKGKETLILYSHGNGGNLTWYTPMADLLKTYGDVFMYDYPGYGLSNGECTEKSVLESGLVAYDYVKSLGYSQIICYGFSMGGAVSIHIASNRDIDGLILQSTFSRISDCIPYIGDSLVGDFFRSIDKVHLVKCPVVVMHSQGDRVVPYSSSEKLFHSILPQKIFIDLVGGHNDDCVSDLHIKQSMDFLKSNNKIFEFKSLSLKESVSNII